MHAGGGDEHPRAQDLAKDLDDSSMSLDSEQADALGATLGFEVRATLLLVLVARSMNIDQFDAKSADLRRALEGVAQLSNVEAATHLTVETIGQSGQLRIEALFAAADPSHFDRAFQCLLAFAASPSNVVGFDVARAQIALATRTGGSPPPAQVAQVRHANLSPSGDADNRSLAGIDDGRSDGRATSSVAQSHINKESSSSMGNERGGQCSGDSTLRRGVAEEGGVLRSGMLLMRRIGRAASKFRALGTRRMEGTSSVEPAHVDSKDEKALQARAPEPSTRQNGKKPSRQSNLDRLAAPKAHKDGPKPGQFVDKPPVKGWVHTGGKGPSAEQRKYHHRSSQLADKYHEKYGGHT
jgi:hypothetical protein